MHSAHRRVYLKLKYLGEIETEFENTLACLSGAQMGSNHAKKTGGRKFRDTLPLKVAKFCGFSRYQGCPAATESIIISGNNF